MSTPAEIAAESLRSKQKPLKDQYRSDPSSAFITLNSSGDLDPTSTSLTCNLASAGAAQKKVAGLHKLAGGEGFDASGELCSGDMLLESLVACYGVTVRAVATAMGIAIQGGTVIVEGDLDFRGTMGIKGEDGAQVPVGFQAIRLKVRLEVGSEDKDKVQKLIELSERYCVVLQTLKKGVDVEVKLGHIGKPVPDARSDSQAHEDGNGQGEGMAPAVGNEDVLKLN
ncbi:uncharacterized protein HMPREF1541_04852 [Cyphellophora europaea CBS 101466]|uniref:OsmC-like protein n=1 Tax=Cyphellophora europaea (strain CBS 101466) TaxID=1220924 RepID=W2RW78_CYPE1|nr:uncharacterized protein HMPREF1541_04852 [Cyphellophora europaea CBS 101466]ETN40575.1 hypothetical protein HMPREF1541_04852 [Cyphellophora europaea CBS 101466]